MSVRLPQIVVRHDSGYYWYIAGIDAERRNAAMLKARRAKDLRVSTVGLYVKHARGYHHNAMRWVRAALKAEL